MHRDEDLTVLTAVLAAYDPATLVPLDAYINASRAPTCWIINGGRMLPPPWAAVARTHEPLRLQSA